MKKYTESDIESELKYFTDLISFKNQPMVIEQKKNKKYKGKIFEFYISIKHSRAEKE